jgi:hypothetical protein
MPVKPVVTAHTLWWRNACVSYDLNQAASKQVPYGTAAQIAAASFSTWTGVQCTEDGGVSQVSIDARDLGPVGCDEVHYNSNQGNQHVIIFDDGVWPHSDSANTLGLTTVTYDPKTGEIYDADIEINATVKLGIDSVSSTEYDLSGILTHEVGHFFGLAHTPDPNATMYAMYEPGSTTKRVLAADDLAGICSIYGSNGSRAVETWTSADGGSWMPGEVAASACDPTPRHGFQSECAVPQSSGCAMAGRATPRDVSLLYAATGLLGTFLAKRRRKCRPSGGRSR